MNPIQSIQQDNCEELYLIIANHTGATPTDSDSGPMHLRPGRICSRVGCAGPTGHSRCHGRTRAFRDETWHHVGSTTLINNYSDELKIVEVIL